MNSLQARQENWLYQAPDILREDFRDVAHSLGNYPLMEEII